MSRELKQHLFWLCEAIVKVDVSYIWHTDILRDSNDEIEQLERAFTYELYHQWRIILEKVQSPLIINTEIRKEVFDKKKEKNCILFPDFVLHAGQGNADNQLLVGEVKRKTGLTPDSVGDDLNALVDYMDNSVFKYPFKAGVFILVGGDDIFLQKKILNEKNQDYLKKWKQYAKKIFCITYNGDFESLSINTLNTLIG